MGLSVKHDWTDKPAYGFNLFSPAHHLYLGPKLYQCLFNERKARDEAGAEAEHSC